MQCSGYYGIYASDVFRGGGKYTGKHEYPYHQQYIGITGAVGEYSHTILQPAFCNEQCIS